MALRRISKAIEKVREQIRGETDHSSKYSRGLASEGYLGGYIQGLNDVSAILRKIPVSNRMERFWEEEAVKK